LIPLICKGSGAISELSKIHGMDTVMKIWNRVQGSEFKRRTSRVIKVSREELFEGL
jgi:hypothetical protein